jgi:hypothetical protein
MRDVLLSVVGLVVGLILIIELVPSTVSEALNSTYVTEFTGLSGFLELVPFLALIGLVIASLWGLFSHFSHRG